RTGTLVAVIDSDRMPEQYKLVPLQQLQFLRFPPELDRTPEAKLQAKLRAQVVDSLLAKLTAAVKESRELALQFGIDLKTDELFGEVNLTPKPETQLARDVAELGQLRSRFAAVPSGEPAALRLLLHWSLPEALTDAVRPT